MIIFLYDNLINLPQENARLKSLFGQEINHIRREKENKEDRERKREREREIERERERERERKKEREIERDTFSLFPSLSLVH